MKGNLLLSIGLGGVLLALTLGLLAVFSPLSPVRADPGDLFVRPDGSGDACTQASQSPGRKRPASSAKPFGLF
jgi:hypothetical protein